jgi:ribosome biogenesis GTPase A
MRVRYSFSSRRTGNIDSSNQHKTTIPELIKKILEDCDIILEVLDARFPQETRNFELEKLIEKQEKKIIFVLNKSDTSNKQINLYPSVRVSCKNKTGKQELLSLIKQEASKINKPRIYLGIIGYPNTGKSSLINFLTNTEKARVSREAGFTKGKQKIKLLPGILLLDTPGVIPESENSATSHKDLVKHSKISVRTYDKVKDPEFVVSELIKQYPNKIEKFYNIQANGNAEILLEELGKRKNYFKKHGEIDIDKTSRIIIRDFQSGKIKI